VMWTHLQTQKKKRKIILGPAWLVKGICSISRSVDQKVSWQMGKEA